MAVDAISLIQAKLTGTELERYKNESELLCAYAYDAEQIAVNTVYPFDETAELPDTPFYRSWIARAAIEMLFKRGAEGQTAHSESGVSRTYENSGISQSLLNELTPKGKMKKLR